MGEFLLNLSHGEPLGKRVYYQRTEKSNTDAPLRQATSITVFSDYSTVLVYPDGTEVFLECTFECGTDRRTSDGGTEGSDFYKEEHAKVFDYADKGGLLLIPGMLDI